MKRLHLFYLSTLLLAWGWGGYRWWQWSGSTAELVHPGAILALQQSHQALLGEMQQGAADYPSAQAAFYTRRAVVLDSLFRLFDHPVNKRTEQEAAIWRDSIQAFLNENTAEASYWQALSSLSLAAPEWLRFKNYLLQRRADQYLSSNVIGVSTNCWDSKLNFSPSENLVLAGDTLHAVVGDLRFSQGNEKIWVNDQDLAGQDSGIDSVFTTPGWHTIDVQVVTPLTYGRRHEARREFKLYVLNHSK